jgi:MoxR-like ATPase
MKIGSVADVENALRGESYLPDRGLATAIFLALGMRRPLLLEGEPGVGKTEVAKTLARVLDADLVRLQCYEGIDSAEALYEWNYPRQLLSIKIADSRGESVGEEDLFSPDYLIRRPLLRALEHPGPRPAVLLIDEIDRADAEFEGYLLELLADFQITIPELGSIRAKRRPLVMLTSNRTREVHDALKRRCLYQWIDYPDFDKELAIVRARLPGAPAELTAQVTAFVQALREKDLYKVPGVSETLDWAGALVALDRDVLDPAAVTDTLGVLLKAREDIAVVRGETLAHLMQRSRAVGAPR